LWRASPLVPVTPPLRGLIKVLLATSGKGATVVATAALLQNTKEENP